MKIGVLFGNPETTSGGRALKFYAAVRLDIRRMEAIKDSGEVIGNRTRVRVKKNKVAPPFRTAEFDIMYNEGISRAGDVLDMAVEVGVVEKRGAYYSYNEDRIGHGRENTKDFLRQNPEIMDEISRKVRENVGALSVPSASDVKEEDTYTEDES
jgi:recombination protein RecA